MHLYELNRIIYIVHSLKYTKKLESFFTNLKKDNHLNEYNCTFKKVSVCAQMQTIGHQLSRLLELKNVQSINRPKDFFISKSKEQFRETFLIKAIEISIIH